MSDGIDATGVPGGGGRDSLRVRFHTANILIPESQSVVTIPAGETVLGAVRAMDAGQFTAIPVVIGDQVEGQLSQAQVLRHLMNSKPEILEGLEVADLMGPPRFLSPRASIEDVLTGIREHEVVLVGHSGDLAGVITAEDMVGYLQQVASPFVLVQEIELAVRHLIRECLTPEEIADAARVTLKSKYEGREGQIPTRLGDLDLSDEIGVLKCSKYRTQLAPGIGLNPDSVRNYLGQISDIRNDLFHFHREATPVDLDTLVKARSWLFARVRQLEATRG